MSLEVLDYDTFVLERSSGENATVDVCVTAEVDSPLERDSIFYISPSPNATASFGSDYIINPPTGSLVVPSGFSGTFSACISIVVLTDNEEEGLESLAIEITARSMFDEVVFPLDAIDDLILIDIEDQGIYIYIYKTTEESKALPLGCQEVTIGLM